MHAASFEYHRPTSVAEAVALLRDTSDAKVLAGGHSLLPLMKLRLAAPSALVDVSRIPGLAGIRVTRTGLQIGALTTHAAIAASSEVAGMCPILAEAAAQIGDTQVRNRGTIGGSLAHADPGADLPTVMVALGATLTLTGPASEREIPADAFFTGIFTTALRPEELVTSISVLGYGAGTGGVYLKHRHPASSYAVVGVAALVSMSGGTCSRVSLVVGGATGNPTRCAAAEGALMGKPADEATLATAAAAVRAAITDPMGDLYASGEYRTHLAGVMAQRALRLAIQRAG